MDGTKIVALADLIGQHATAIHTTLQETSTGSPGSLPSLSPPAATQQSQNKLLDALEQLRALVIGPLGTILNAIGPQVNIFISLQGICRFHVAERLQVDETITFEELATRCDLDPGDLKRLLRNAIAHNIFIEPKPGFVSHNKPSHLLWEMKPLSAFVEMTCDEMWTSGPRAIDAMQKWPGSEEPNQTAFSLAHGAGELGFFETLSRDSVRAERFATSMMFQQASPLYWHSHLLEKLGWTTDAKYLVVDVGGSTGATSKAILERYPNVQCVVQDAEEIVGRSQVPESLTSRLRYQAHDIFETQPQRNADFYLLRSVLHNWSDKYAVKILQGLLPALRINAKIIINDICLPVPGEATFRQERFLRGFDLAMKQNLNGRERDLNDWKALIAKVDHRLRLDIVTSPPGSLLSILQLSLVELLL